MKDKNLDKEDRDILKALSESLQNFSKTLTGKNLEEKLMEYSEVYGEILLFLYRENQNFRNEILSLKRKIHNLQKEKINEKPVTIPVNHHLVKISLILNLINLVLILYLLWK